jgi:hypothetical protein
MNNDTKKIKNPTSLWVIRIAFLGSVLFLLPLSIFDVYTDKTTPVLINMLALFLVAYVTLANYILFFRFDTPPTWARWVVRAKWIVEAREIFYTDPEVLKADPKRRGRLITGAVVLIISLLMLIGVNL